MSYMTMTRSATEKPASKHAPNAGTGATAPRMTAAELFGTAREVIIEHNGREYRLRLTAHGKLLLTA